VTSEQTVTDIMTELVDQAVAALLARDRAAATRS
jgi:hypothetical protein